MTRPVRLVTDSAGDLPLVMAAELGITVVPLTVRFGDDAYRDGLDMTGEEFFRRLRLGSALPKTSLPSPEQFGSAYRELLAAGNDVLSLHVTSKVSGTFGSAWAASKEFPADRIHVLDTRLATLPQALVVRQAALAARKGDNLDLVDAAARSWAARANLYAMLDTLEYLRRGGRIGRLAALVGGLLAVKPIISLKDGEPVAVARVRTRGQGLDRLIDLVVAEAPFEGPIVVGHSDNVRAAELVRDRLLEKLPGTESFISEIGAVIGTHAGPGAVGVGLIRAETR